MGLLRKFVHSYLVKAHNLLCDQDGTASVAGSAQMTSDTAPQDCLTSQTEGDGPDDEYKAIGPSLATSRAPVSSTASRDGHSSTGEVNSTSHGYSESTATGNGQGWAKIRAVSVESCFVKAIRLTMIRRLAHLHHALRTRMTRSVLRQTTT